MVTLQEAKFGLKKLKDSGMRKINFAGGEPFLYPKFLAELCRYCKIDLKLESVSIISNGSLIKEDWLRANHDFIDILGISCDSFQEDVNIKIGRGNGKQIENIFRIRELCHIFNIKFKLNTVVCKYNFKEDMNDFIDRLKPFRWKCFQVLIVKTENDGNNNSLRNANEFLISKEEYDDFIKRHKGQKCLIVESNSIMKSSYLILDEFMRFLDKGDDYTYVISDSILNVSVNKALSQIKWDQDSFKARQGEYNWSNSSLNTSTISCSSQDKNLEW
ncbi:radical S-adenosyl methionine domain-containing 2 [Brachionus plicatilis]|uniref:Radical S-adenosyl methionine domain-containing 2 n=1 Tax=Brachionus plicatilis TaxID=10195 RepID=A0A3M7S0R6_BRAPC|nr:radical S-adenosyl methionine domain-containing 2 [Brachionus plicatilis]